MDDPEITTPLGNGATMRITRSLLLLTLALIAGVVTGLLRGAEGSEFEIEARAVPLQEAAAAAGEFALEGEVASRIDVQKGELAVRPKCVTGGLKLGSAECGCLCSDAIFVDGFESGDTTAWSSSVP